MNHRMTRGNKQVINFPIVDGNGAALNLDGLTLKCLFKASHADADAAALITKTSGSGIVARSPQATAANTGWADLTLLPVDTTTPPGISAGVTTTLVYELRLINGTEVSTLETGTLTIERDVVRAIA